MVEIILGVWTVCLCISVLIVAYGYFLTQKKLSSKKLDNLNSNLKKIGLFWSNSSADFMSLEPGAPEADRKKVLRTSLFIGFLGLASIPGTLLLIIVVISIHFIAITRKERATFNSRLTQTDSLEQSEISRLVEELKRII